MRACALSLWRFLGAAVGGRVVGRPGCGPAAVGAREGQLRPGAPGAPLRRGNGLLQMRRRINTFICAVPILASVLQRCI